MVTYPRESLVRCWRRWRLPGVSPCAGCPV